MRVANTTSQLAESARRSRKRRIGLWVCFTFGVLILFAAALSFSTAFGVIWSSGSSKAETIHALGWRHGRFAWERYGLTPPGTTPIPFRLKSATASAGLWSPPPGSGVTVAGRTTVRTPFWTLLLPVGIPATILLRQAHRANLRAKRGCCRNCGYDLKGHEPVNGIKTCPECGQRKGRPSPMPRASASS